ncbi:MAG: substrate-binding domain-containing protein [Thermodesulfovibrionales bacterium]
MVTLWRQYTEGFMAVCFISALILPLCMVLQGCSDRDKPVKVDFAKKEEAAPVPAVNSVQPLRIAVGGMITPKEGFGYYRAFLDYLAEKLGRPVKFVDRQSYAEINKLLRTGEVDVAFVCGGPYVSGKREFGMELLAAPVAYGKSVYYSYIIVHKDSPLERFEDLRGKSFGFTDPLSNSGKLVPTAMLARMGETPGSYFSKVVYTKTHDRSISAVAERIIDGAAVDSLIWDYENRRNPAFTSKTRVILKSPPYGIPPVVVRPGLSPELKSRVRGAFLNAHHDPKGAQILKEMMIDRFVPIDDSAYDSIRELEGWDARQQGKQQP